MRLYSEHYPWFSFFPLTNFREDRITWDAVSKCIGIYSIERRQKVVFNSVSGQWKISPKEIEGRIAALPGAEKIYEHNNAQTVLYIFKEGVVDLFFPKPGSTAEGVLTWVSCDPQLTESLREMSKLIAKQEPEGRVHVLVPTPSGVQKYPIGLGAIPIEKTNYRPEVLTGYSRIVKDLGSQNPLGRLVILSGPTGTGKTYLIRALMGELPRVVFLLLPSNMTANLSGPEILSALIDASESVNCTCEECLEAQAVESDKLKDFCESKDWIPFPMPASKSTHFRKRTIALVLEDADSCLSNRASDNISAISAVLNLSDGIIGNCLDLRIICTTNQEIENIDSALLRTGRLSEHIEVGLLDVEQAKSVYQRIGGTIEQNWSKKFYPLSDIYAMSKDERPLEPVEKKPSIGFFKRENKPDQSPEFDRSHPHVSRP